MNEPEPGQAKIYCPECGGRGWVNNIFEPCELCEGDEFVPASIGRGYCQEENQRESEEIE